MPGKLPSESVGNSRFPFDYLPKAIALRESMMVAPIAVNTDAAVFTRPARKERRSDTSTQTSNKLHRGGSRNSLKGGGSGPEFFEGGVRVQVRGNSHILTSKKKEKQPLKGGGCYCYMYITSTDTHIHIHTHTCIMIPVHTHVYLPIVQ